MLHSKRNLKKTKLKSYLDKKDYKKGFENFYLFEISEFSSIYVYPIFRGDLTFDLIRVAKANRWFRRDRAARTHIL